MEEFPLFATAKESKPSVLTVSELTYQIKDRLERSFHDVWVGGEVGKVSDHPSGMYFSLKDEQALIEAVIWRREVRKVLKFALEQGAQVVVHGHLDLYTPRGQYKLIVDQVEPKGIGALQKRFEQLKKKLAEEGLFEESRKRPLPFLPHRIGIVTARDGAAFQDMLRTILDRYPKASIVLRASRVQGESAAAEIAKAIGELNELPDLDVMIVGRGGGSLEDLWAFNEEVVARAIATSRVPVISAVGHEVDFSIADFVADRRAKTPTDAGVIVVPKLDDVESQLLDHQHRLYQRIQGQLRELRDRLKGIREHWVLRKPVDLIQNLKSQIEDSFESMSRALEQSLRGRKDRCIHYAEKLTQLRPDLRLAKQQSHVQQLFSRSETAIAKRIARAQERYSILAERLEGRSPVAILSRGYSLTRIRGQNQLITNANQLQQGQTLEVAFHKGKAITKVESIEP